MRTVTLAITMILLLSATGTALSGSVSSCCSCGTPKTMANPASYPGYTQVAGEDNGTIGTPPLGGRFTNTLGTSNSVTDNGTGLIWIKNPAAIGTIGGYDFASTMSWEHAFAAVAALNAANNGAGYDGSNKWRLPNVRELQSIVDYGRANPSIDTSFFTSQSCNYWSSTTYFDRTGDAWSVGFWDGYVDGCSKVDIEFYVRPVRNG